MTTTKMKKINKAIVPILAVGAIFLSRPLKAQVYTDEVIVEQGLNGNVGIGIAPPASNFKLFIDGKLHVKNGDSGFDASNVSGLLIESSGNSNTNSIFRTSSVGGGNSFSITNAGKVGIGLSTAPTEKLDVDGNIKASGGFIAGGNITSSATVVGGAVQSSGALYFANNSKLVQLLTTNNGTTPTTSDIVIDGDASNFWAQITITGNETNLHNHDFLWHGVLTWDTVYDQISLVPISSVNLSATAVNEGGQIILRITNTLGSTHYPWVKGSAVIVK